MSGGQMGLPYVPFTFPTTGVFSYMKRAGVDTSYDEVDRIWDAYYIATVQNKVPVYNPKEGGKNIGALLNNINKQTSIPKNTIAAWLNALVDEVNANGGTEYLDPVTAVAAVQAGKFDIMHPIESLKLLATDAGQVVGGAAGAAVDPVTNLVKWAAILVVGGAVIYGVYHGAKYFNGKRKE